MEVRIIDFRNNYVFIIIMACIVRILVHVYVALDDTPVDDVFLISLGSLRTF